MTPQEFNRQLWPYLTARYLQVSHWLGLLPATARHDRDTTQSEVLAAWQNILGDVGLQDAKSAIDAMVKADPPREFKNLSDFPTAIRSEARRIAGERSRARGDDRPRIVNGERTYRCPTCLDTGVVVVFHPSSHKAAREFPTEFVERGKDDYSCAVACLCNTGRERNADNAVRLNVDKMVIRTGCSREQKKNERRELVDILASRDQRCPSGSYFD